MHPLLLLGLGAAGFWAFSQWKKPAPQPLPVYMPPPSPSATPVQVFQPPTSPILPKPTAPKGKLFEVTFENGLRVWQDHVYDFTGYSSVGIIPFGGWFDVDQPTFQDSSGVAWLHGSYGTLTGWIIAYDPDVGVSNVSQVS